LIYRTATIIVALATLTSNSLSALLFHQLPDDPYHLANSFGWYLHFANLLSVFGFIGAVRKHALSIAIFANYLVLDTILCCIPRFLLLGLFKSYSSDLCTDPSLSSSQIALARIGTPGIAGGAAGNVPSGLIGSFQELAYGWTPQGCLKIVWLAQLTFAAGVVAATLLQFVGALCVREYAKMLWLEDVDEDIVLLIEEFGDDDEVRGRRLWYRDSCDEQRVPAGFNDPNESLDEKNEPLV